MPESGVYFSVPFCLRSLRPLERCERAKQNTPSQTELKTEQKTGIGLFVAFRFRIFLVILPRKIRAMTQIETPLRLKYSMSQQYSNFGSHIVVPEELWSNLFSAMISWSVDFLCSLNFVLRSTYSLFM